MSEKRFVVETVEITDCDTDVSRIAKVITDTKETYSYEELYEVAELLNEQQATIEAKDSLLSVLSKENEQLRQQLKEKEEDEKLYANEILELRKTNEEHIKFKSLGGDY